MEDTTIQIKDENGNLKDANLLNVVTIDNQDYALYYIENDNENSDLFASRVITDANNNKVFEDLKDNEEKAKIIKYIQETLNS